MLVTLNTYKCSLLCETLASIVCNILYKLYLWYCGIQHNNVFGHKFTTARHYKNKTKSSNSRTTTTIITERSYPVGSSHQLLYLISQFQDQSQGQFGGQGIDKAEDMTLSKFHTLAPPFLQWPATMVIVSLLRGLLCSLPHRHQFISDTGRWLAQQQFFSSTTTVVAAFSVTIGTSIFHNTSITHLHYCIQVRIYKGSVSRVFSAHG